MGITKDIKTAAGVYKKLREAGKEGKKLEVKTSIVIPLFKAGPGFLDTVEGCEIAGISRNLYDLISPIFRCLPYEDRHRLSFSPVSGEYAGRALMWKALLEPVLPPEQCHKVMHRILNKYVRLKRHEMDRKEDGMV